MVPLLRLVYSGTWRSDLPRLEIPLEDLPDLLHSLLQSGGAGLFWPRVKHRAEEYGAAGEILARTYQQYADNLVNIESDIALISSRMADAGIEAVLVKGWALSSLYTPPQIRRPGDIDLIVPTNLLGAAKRVVSQAHADGLGTPIDLIADVHWREKGNCPADDFRDRLHTRYCAGVRVPVLNDADALRHVCLHIVRHLQAAISVTSPLWLCDIGALIEHPESDIDWARVLNNDDGRARDVKIAIALAREMVGVDSSKLPPELQDFHLPVWAVESVLNRWAVPIQSGVHEIQTRGLFPAMVRLWPSKLNAALYCNVSLNRRFYFPYQAWTFLGRIGDQLARKFRSRTLLRG